MSRERQRTDFQYDEFYWLVRQKGYMVTWEKAVLCPCITKDKDGQPDFNCPLCKGKGKYWHDPQDIQGIMTNLNEQDKFTQSGEIMAGTSYFTTLPTFKLGFWDRITHWHSTVRFSEVVVKGDQGGKDYLRFNPIEVVCGKSLRTVKTEYLENVDYVVDNQKGLIDWSPGASHEPLRGERYTVDYMINPRWIVIDLINVIRDTYVKRKKPGIVFQEMPVRAMVRLEWFVL